MGRLIRKKTPSATSGVLAVTRYIYDSAGNKIKEIMPEQYQAGLDTPALVVLMTGSSFTYDSMNRVETIKSPADIVLECRKYDGNGNLIKSIDGLHYNGNVDTSSGSTISYDALNRVVSTCDVLKNSTLSEYDSVGNLFKTTDKRGNVTQYDYYPDRTLWKITYPDNGIIEYQYDNLGHVIQKKDQRGYITKYEYDGYGNLHRETDGYNNYVEYNYDPDNNLESVRDKRGNITSFAYDKMNRLTQKKTPLELLGGNIVYSIENYEYDGVGNTKRKDITGTKDPGSHRITEYAYYDNNLIDTITDNASGYQKYYYDMNNNLKQLDARQSSTQTNTTKYEYDNRNRLTKTIKLVDAGIIYSIQNAPNYSNLIKDGYIRLMTGYEYDILGNKIKEYSPKAYEYLETDTSNRAAYTKTYTYDDLNRLDKSIWEYNNVEVFSQNFYDAAGNLNSSRDEKGNITSYTYDEMNRLETITSPIDQAAGRITTTFGYDEAGNKTSEKDALNHIYTYTYDKLNRLETIIDPYQRIISKKIYDENGNIIKEIDAKGYLSGNDDNSKYGTSYQYDLANRPDLVINPEVAEKGGPSKYSSKLEYNQYGEKTASYDALDHVTNYTYDNAGRLMTVTNPKQETTSYNYDSAGNMTYMKDGREKVTFYAYGVFGLLSTMSEPGENMISKQYDMNINVSRIVDGKGNETLYTYDNMNLMLSRSVAQTGDIIVYTYDESGNRKTMTCSADTNSYDYDANGRLTDVKKNNLLQLHYAYDEVGNLQSLTDVKNYTTSYTYDDCNRMKTVTFGNRAMWYDYDENGNKQYVNYPGGNIEAYEYYKDNSVKSVVNTAPGGVVISSYVYAYDLAGNLTSKTDSFSPNNPTIYQYDENNRIKAINAPGQTTLYDYDASGNRKTMLETHTSMQTDQSTGINIGYISKYSQYEYSDSNRMTLLSETLKDPSQVLVLKKETSYYYDGNGNLVNQNTQYIKPISGSGQSTINAFVSDSGGQFNSIIDYSNSTYDGFNRLVKYEDVSNGVRTITAYAYDGDDQRIKKTVEKSNNSYIPDVTDFLYVGQRVTLEMDASGNVKARYVDGIDYVARMDGSSNISYFMYNGHGDVVQTVSESGTIEKQYDYDIFGNPTLTIEQYSCNIRYAGYQYDSETGLYYLNARYYDSKIARFLSEDTYGGDANDPLSLNLYTYCQNNPLMYTDPTGHYLYYDGNDGKMHESDVIVDENHPYVDYGVPNSGIFVYDDTDNINASNSAGVGVYGDSTVGTIYTSDDSSTSIYNYGTIGAIITGDNTSTNVENSGDIGLITTGNNSKADINNSGSIGIINVGSGSESHIDNSGNISTIVASSNTTNNIRNSGSIVLVYSSKSSNVYIDNVKDVGDIGTINNVKGGIVFLNGQRIFGVYKGTGNSDGTVYAVAATTSGAHRGGLTQEQMEANASYIYDYFTKIGWSKEAICGVLGNMQWESGSINPGAWQNWHEANAGDGYGVVQWTPAGTKFFSWMGFTTDNQAANADKMAKNDPKQLMDKQLEFLLINLNLAGSKEEKRAY